jgi:hypothetical protein
MAPVLEGKSIGSDQKIVLKGELLIWRTKNQARDQSRVQLTSACVHLDGKVGNIPLENKG